MIPQYMASKRGKKAILALGAGAVLALAMPGLGLGPLAFVGLIPLFFALEGGGGFVPGFLAGFVFFAIDLRWILTLFRFTPLVVAGYVLLAAYLALYFGLFGLLTGWFLKKERPGVALLVFAPSLFALLELARSLGPLGVGFSDLYLALHRFPVLIQAAAVLGPFALTAGIAFANAAFYLAWRRRRAYALAGLGMVGALAACSLLPVAPNGEAVAVAVVTSEVAQESRFGGETLESLLARYLRLGEEAAALRPDLIVFPETILPDYILRDPKLLAEFARLARQANARVLVGTGDFRNGDLTNAVALLDRNGDVVGSYDKVHPVPFGEYVPGRALWAALGLEDLFSSLLPVDITPGRGFTPLGDLGTPICFETTFPAASRALAARGAALLVTVTNDAWFVGSSELTEHFAAAVFRAVETRRFVIQSANGGISGAVDARGRILSETEEEGVTVVQAARRHEPSPYTRWGEPLSLAVLVGGVGAGLVWRTERRQTG